MKPSYLTLDAARDRGHIGGFSKSQWINLFSGDLVERTLAFSLGAPF